MNSTASMMSSPADPGALSFLDLPAELRNWVYEVYFKYDDKLYLANDGIGSVSSSWRHEGHRPRWPTDYNEMALKRGGTASWPEAQPRQIQLLRVCKQIHQEAASMLYSNELYIAKRLDAHSITHDTTGHYVNETSTIWLRQIGQHQLFVCKLVIDLGSTCPVGCEGTEQARAQTFRRTDGYLHFGDLLQAIWASDLKIAIIFVDPTRNFHIQFFEGHRQDFPYSQSVRSAERLTRTFEALAKDELGMKRFRRAIGDVGIKADCTGGVFAFWTPEWRYSKNRAQASSCDDRNPLLDHARYFSSGRDVKLCFSTRGAQESHMGLLDLPRSVLTKVVEQTVYSHPAHELDLDSFADMKDLYGILHTAPWIHDNHIAYFLRDSTFNLSIMTSDANKKFDLSKLERLLQTSFRDYSNGQPHSVRFGALDNYSIDLHVHFGTPTFVGFLGNIRIDITTIVASTFAASDERTVRIHLHNGTSVLRGHTSTIRKLRLTVSTVLSRYVKKDHPNNINIRCPEIWIDGHGKIVDTVSTGSVEGERVIDPAKENPTLWSAESTGSYVGAKTPVVPKADGLARNMYMYLKWIK